MESKNKVGSSFIDLFGSKEDASNKSSTTTGVFASMFQPPSTTMSGRYSSNSDTRGTWQKHSSRNQEWNTKKESSAPKSENGAKTSRKEKSSAYQDGKVEPCQLSSSIYYGGQDVYSHSSSAQDYGSSSSYPNYAKSEQDGESNGGHTSQSASRGNWWEGSLYY